jgi:hypothetical protein
MPTISFIPPIHPSFPLNATVRVPGSKSLTNRALLIAALANGQTHLTNALFSDDSRYFANALKTLGFDIQLDEVNHEMTVTGLGGNIPAKSRTLHRQCRHRGADFSPHFSHSEMVNIFWTASRVCANVRLGIWWRRWSSWDVIFIPWTMDDRPQKPSSSIVNLSASENYRIWFAGGKTKIAGDISSQFFSALLMVAPTPNLPSRSN